MYLFDAILTLDATHKIIEIRWENPKLQQQYADSWETWIGQHFSQIFTAASGSKPELLYWNHEEFLFYRQNIDTGKILYFLKKHRNQEYLYRQALNRIADGVQIYDEHAYAVFFNNSSRKISDIPVDADIEGHHLLDLYHLDKGISTVLTSLKNRTPVINRVDKFKSADGTTISTANTAFPVFRGKDLVGSVIFEQDANVLKSRIRQLESIQKALKSQDSLPLMSRFSGYTFDNIIGKGEKLQEAITLAKRIAPQTCNILLVGETGTGKEVFAQSIHRESNRRNKKFLALNCAAIPDTLIESLLFGTTRGSFTGSVDKPGLFEEANHGTLFLDELNSMSLSMQSKILRVIQENICRRVGGDKDIPIDVRIISSCNEDPFEAIAGNRLRKDLFYRLSTVMIDLPPLREHISDLEELIYYHLDKNSHLYVKSIAHIQPKVLALLKSYSWPGNIRELFHVLDYVQNVVDGDTIEPEHLPKYINNTARPEESQSASAPLGIDFVQQDLQALMDDYENQILRQALAHFGYNITHTADALGLRRQSLQYRIKKYGIIV